jgi:addiction module HigA family antidote
MIRSFRDKRTENLARGKAPKTIPSEVAKRAVNKLFLLDTVTRLEDLRVPPGNRLEALVGNRRGQHAIRVNDQWRLCFVWRDGEAHDVEFVVTSDIPMPHPGIILREEFIEPMGLSVYALAKAIHVTRSRINEICHGRQGITANIALRLGRFFDVDPQWFMNMQAKYDLHVQSALLADDLAAIQPRTAA